MGFEETNEQQQIRDAVRNFASSQLPRFQTDQFHNTVPLELFRELSALGVTGLSVPEEFGGIAASPTTSLIVMEELARVDLGPAIFVSVHSMVSGLVRSFGTAEQRESLLPRLASGEMLAAFALTEPSAGSDAQSLTCRATKTDGGYLLNGDKCYITSAGWAGMYLVFARTTPEGGSRGISAFIVESGPRGSEPKGFVISPPERKMGCELSPIASLAFSDHFVPDNRVLGDIDNGYRIALSGLAGGRVNIAGCAIGLCDAALERSVAHLKERKQFGSALADFQGLQFMLADMKIATEAARSVTWQSARSLETGGSDRTLPSIAKCFATDTAMRVTTDAVQLLGGAGYLKEYQVERLMRDAKMLQIVEGTNQIQRSIIARSVLS